MTGGGRQPLSARFVRHFTQLCIPPPSEAATKTILTTILGGFLADGGQDLKALCAPLVTCATETYNRVCAELLPTPAKSHYTFNLRDLCKVAQVSILQCRQTVLTSNEPEGTPVSFIAGCADGLQGRLTSNSHPRTCLCNQVTGLSCRH